MPADEPAESKQSEGELLRISGCIFMGGYWDNRILNVPLVASWSTVTVTVLLPCESHVRQQSRS